MIKPLKDYIFNSISKINGNVIPGSTRPEGNSYPSITYTFTSSSPEDNDRDNIIIEINIWGNEPDCEAIDTITDNIEKEFKKLRYLDLNQLLIFQKLSRLELPDDDEYIRRRMLRYLIKREER